MGESLFDSVADKYDAWYDTKGKVAFETELAALRPLLPDLPEPWFEVGVGTGRFAQALGIPVGLDPSAELVARARERGPEGKPPIRLKLHLVEHDIDEAGKHAAAVNEILQEVEAPGELLRPPEVRYVETAGSVRLVTEIWTGKPV